MSTKKKREKNWAQVYLEFIPFWCLYALIRRIPLKPAYRIARAMAPVLYYLDARHRNRTVSHLLHAGIVRDAAEARVMAKNVYRQFAMLLVEIFKADQVYDLKRMHFSGNPESIRRLTEGSAAERQNVIITTAHYGNWEIAGGTFSLLSRTPMVSIMRPFGNPLIGELILRNRRTPEHELVDKSGGIREILRALRAHKHVALLVDQHASASESVLTTFFGHPCQTHSSPALLHLKTRVPILPQMTRRLPGDDFAFELEVGEMIDYEPTGDQEHDIREITQRYTTALENMIREEPTQWLWAHRRWLDINRKTAVTLPPPETSRQATHD